MNRKSIAWQSEDAVLEVFPMPTIDDTAYPRLRASIPKVELEHFYTPTQEELDFSKAASRLPSSQAGFLILLKTFPRLGYFTMVAKVPAQILNHVIKSAKLPAVGLMEQLASYDHSSSRWKHQDMILGHLKVHPYSKVGEEISLEVMRKAVQTKDDLVDLINTSVEELIRLSTELPGFSVLLKRAKAIRSDWNDEFFLQVSKTLNHSQKGYIDQLFSKKDAGPSDWEILKQDAGNPTIENLRAHLNKLRKLDGLAISESVLNGVPNIKIERFAEEAKTFDIWRMQRFAPEKRYALALCLFKASKSQVLDDLGEMLVKRLTKLHHDAEADLEEWRAKQQSKTDELIGKLEKVVEAIQGSRRKRLRQIEKVLGNKPDQVKRDCEAYSAFSENNYFSFILPRFSSSRNTLFDILDEIQLISTTSDGTTSKVPV